MGRSDSRLEEVERQIETLEARMRFWNSLTRPEKIASRKLELKNSLEGSGLGWLAAYNHRRAGRDLKTLRVCEYLLREGKSPRRRNDELRYRFLRDRRAYKDTGIAPIYEKLSLTEWVAAENHSPPLTKREIRRRERVSIEAFKAGKVVPDEVVTASWLRSVRAGNTDLRGVEIDPILKLSGMELGLAILNAYHEGAPFISKGDYAIRKGVGTSKTTNLTGIRTHRVGAHVYLSLPDIESVESRTKGLLLIKDLAKDLGGVTTGQLRRWYRVSGMPSVKVDHLRYYSPSDVRAWLEEKGMTPMIDTVNYITTKETSSILGEPKHQLYRWRNLGGGPSYVTMGSRNKKIIRYERASVVAFAKSEAKIEELISEKELAGHLRLDVRTVRRWRYTGIGPHYVTATRRRTMYPKGSTQVWCDDNGYEANLVRAR